MKELTQNFKTGKLELEDIPAPSLKKGFLLVENRFSLISPGTERATVDTAKASIVAKAQKRPDLLRQVVQNVKREGVAATLQKVAKRLDTPKPLGYSSCGIVIESMDFGGRFRPKERVACAGQGYASHAEIVSVPQNLAVKIPDNVSFEEAAFTTLGAIALQGIRRADARVGEKVCVIGLGLIGQITLQLLKTSGCSVFGIDLSDFALEVARKAGADFVASRKDDNLYKLLDNFADGLGFDKVIITASSNDNDPILLALDILRKRGIIVLVGNVKMDIPREPNFYKKELELKMATSYGPGRYDPLYEEQGIDYPYAYVRFTEKRNMEAFLELASKGLLDLKTLVTHTFEFKEAIKAYDLILSGQKEDSIGILLKYREEKSEPLKQSTKISSAPLKEINIGFIGAGNFAQDHLLPYLVKKPVSLDTVVTTRGLTAKTAAERFGFNVASSDSGEVIKNEKINTVFIATHHNTHAEYVCRALAAGKNIFVEKPLCLNIDELKKIISAYDKKQMLMVGFNRRFSKASSLIREDLKALSGPVIMNFRINSGSIPGEHWSQNPDIGGGRIIGEVCHFIDLMLYLTGSKPKRVFASSIGVKSSKWRADDNIAANIEFEDGSLGNIVYTAMGDTAMQKERLEIFAKGNAYLIDDFKELSVFNNNRRKRIKIGSKGHKEELDSFLEGLKNGKSTPIDFQSIVSTTLTTFKIMDSLKSGCSEEIDGNSLY